MAEIPGNADRTQSQINVCFSFEKIVLYVSFTTIQDQQEEWGLLLRFVPFLQMHECVRSLLTGP